MSESYSSAYWQLIQMRWAVSTSTMDDMWKNNIDREAVLAYAAINADRTDRLTGIYPCVYFFLICVLCSQ